MTASEPLRRRVRRANLLGLVALLATTAQACLQTGTGNRALAHSSAAQITLSGAGDRLGPITAGTPFSVVELRSLFPAATVTKATAASEGERYPVLRVAEGQTVLLELRSADGLRIYSVEITPAARVGNLGVRHGDTYAEVFGADARPDCVPGTEEQSGQVICPAPSSSHVSLAFDGLWAGPDGELPPPEALRGWTVERVIWRP
jgi:hypothetical protein